MKHKTTTLDEFLKTGDEKLKNELIKENSALIHKIIQNHFDYPHLIDDMFQIGCLGLLKAINNYDPAKGQFSTLAYHSVRNSIIMFLKKETNEFGSYLHKRTKVDPIYLETIAAPDNSLGVHEAVGFVFSKMDQGDVSNLKKKFGMAAGKVKYFDLQKSMNRFSQQMKKFGIKRSDFYR